MSNAHSGSAATVVLPERAGSRPEARELLEKTLPDALDNAVVRVDGGVLAASSSSFIDEIVKGILVDRRGAKLVLWRAPTQVAIFASASAQRRRVEAKLQVKQS
jgi:hypothetical protein